MAIQRFKVALNNARFPLVSTKAQRAAFVQGLTNLIQGTVSGANTKVVSISAAGLALGTAAGGVYTVLA